MPYFTKETIPDMRKRVAKKGLSAFQTMKYNHSFRLMGSTSSVIKLLHEKKFSCDRKNVKCIRPFCKATDFLKTLTYITTVLHKYKHSNKIIAFCGGQM
jgi:hypothetical protein